MNITHVVENLNRGGLERMVIDLVRVQHVHGHRCQVVCLYEAGTLAPELGSLGVPVHACGKRGGPDPRALWRARRAVRGHRTEVLHTHNAMAHYQAVLACLGLPIRCVINSRHGMTSNRRAPRLEWLYRRTMRRTDAVVGVCEAARADAVALGIVPPAKSRVIRNGIPMAAFAAASAAMHRRLCQELGLADDIRIVGSVGRLNRIKDQATLICAFARVHAVMPRARLVLVGDGPLRAELERCARATGVAAAVHFLGDRNDVPALLQGLDLFVLSSLSEAYSMALLEASATALPIVATDVGGNREIVCPGHTGWLVPARDPAALAAAVQAALQDADAARGYGVAARAWALAEGSLQTMAARYEALYRDPARQP